MPKVVVVMGVAGSGKTTIGSQLAKKTGAKFVDADSFHSQANKSKMAAGIALTDEDRAPWLGSMQQAIAGWLSDGQAHILACSALKNSYREQLGTGDQDVAFVYLKVNEPTARLRLAARRDHYMKSDMVESQFSTLEEPSPQEAVVVDAAEPPDQIVSQVIAQLTGERAASSESA